ncbi:MAG: glycosyltransferase family A protein, partial [Candidatus Margulisiibacteriota bacterium]
MIPKVSVVIAAHNHAHFLPDCLGSVKAQTYPDYEVIVIDNGSTDNTKETVQKLAWDKLRYHYQADTGSVAGPRNTGTKLARGEYVAYLDSDDSWRPDKLAKVMKVLVDRPEIDLVTHELVTMINGRPGEVLHVGRNSEDAFHQLL